MATTPPPYNPNDPAWQKSAREQQKANKNAWKAYNKAQRDQQKAYYRGMYRTSIVGPILLIAFGVMFLFAHYGKFSWGNLGIWFGHWWPLLLIVIGIVRLVEWFLIRHETTANGVPLRSVMGGGGSFLVILLVVLGIGFTLANNHQSDWSHLNFSGDDWEHFAGTKHENDPAPVVQSIPTGASLFIRNPYGSVAVSGLSDDGKLHIQAHNEVYVTNDSDAEDRLKQLDGHLDISDKTVSLNVGNVEAGHSDLKVMVPAGTNVTINADRGDVHVGDIHAAVNVTANRGDVELKGITGPVVTHVNHRDSDTSIENVTGPVSLEGRGDEINIGEVHGPVVVHGEFYSSIHVQHITSMVTFKSMRTDMSLGRLDGELDMGGDDELRVEQAAGPITVNTKNRNIVLNRVNGDVSVSNRNGTVTIDGVKPIGNISVDNRSGAVTLSLPDSTAFTVQADTSDGDVRSDFALNHRSSDNAGSLSGTVNGGGKAIRISTTHGDISLRHGDAAPLPPMPPSPPAPPAVPSAPSTETDQALKDAQQELKEAQQRVKEAQANAAEQVKRANEQVRKAKQQATKQKKEEDSY